MERTCTHTPDTNLSSGSIQVTRSNVALSNTNPTTCTTTILHHLLLLLLFIIITIMITGIIHHNGWPNVESHLSQGQQYNVYSKHQFIRHHGKYPSAHH